LVELTTQSTPKAATHCRTRTMGAEIGGSAASVSRHWRANGLKPHLVRGFKVSRDPKFVEKLEDIVGLYLSASWLNTVERLFRDITTERLRRGVFTSVPELVSVIDEYIADHNNHPKAFI